MLSLSHPVVVPVKNGIVEKTVVHNGSVMGKLCGVGAIMLIGRMFRPHSLSSLCDSILGRGILL